MAFPPSAIANASVHCQLDNEQTSPNTFTLNPPDLSSNNYILCTAGSSFPLAGNNNGQPASNSDHKLTVTIDGLMNSRVYLDYLVYELISDPDAPLDGDVVQIGNNAQTAVITSQNNIVYSSGWGTSGFNSVGLNPASTSTPGSSVTVKFNGKWPSSPADRNSCC
jgi:hypothetical protein